jgi:lysophospholipase L1-like esterase
MPKHKTVIPGFILHDRMTIIDLHAEHRWSTQMSYADVPCALIKAREDIFGTATTRTDHSRRKRRLAICAILVSTTFFLVHNQIEQIRLSIAQTKETGDSAVMTPASCLSEFSSAPSWSAFLNQTAALAPMDRCRQATAPSTALNETTNDNSTVPAIKDCQCPNPFEPIPRRLPSWLSWSNACARNLALITPANVDVNVTESNSDTESSFSNHSNYQTLYDYDVVMLGDSITEGWLGTKWAIPRKDLREMPALYQDLFAPSEPHPSPGHTGSVRGLPLGLAGDQTSHLLYRLSRGEGDVKSKVYWITIGVNDFLEGHCSANLIVAGTIQIIEALWMTHANRNVTIVVSSILPWGATSLLEQNAKWEAIRRVNRALECYTQSTHMLGTSSSAGSRVEFFNATDIFLSNDGQYVNATYMSSDMLHPSPAGYRERGTAIVDHVQSILATK